MNDAAAVTIEPIDIHKLLDYLPHRYPFMMVDRIAITKLECFDERSLPSVCSGELVKI